MKTTKKMSSSQPLRLNDLSPERLQALSPQLRRAAHFVVEHSGDVATRSQRHIADVSQLPAPTFTRLAHAVGLRNYDQLRDLCRDEVLQSRTALADRAQALVEQGASEAGDPPLLARHVSAATRNLQRIVERIDPERLTEAAKLLAGARRVVLIGEMSARGLMEYASYLANMALTGWQVLGRTGEGLSSGLAVLGPEDACIVTAISPYSTRTVETANLVVECGVPMIAVTDNALSPLAALADHSFFVGTESPQFFPSHVPSMMVFEALVDMVIRERGAEAQKHIAAVERQNHKLKEYWQDHPAGQLGVKTNEKPS